MITTTYTCDRCGASQITDTQLWAVGVVVVSWGFAPSSHGGRPTALWCRKCVDELQLLGRSKPETVITIAPLDVTLEDKLREVIRVIVAEETRT